MRTVTAIVLLSCCALGQDKAVTNPGVFTNSAAGAVTTYHSVLVNNPMANVSSTITPTSHVDALLSAMNIPSNTTATTLPAITGYTFNGCNTNSGTSCNGVGIVGYANNTANGAWSWGSNFLVGDHMAGGMGQHLGAIGVEYDMYGTGQYDSWIGIQFPGGQLPNTFSMPAGGVAININGWTLANGTQMPWPNGLVFGQGATTGGPAIALWPTCIPQSSCTGPSEFMAFRSQNGTTVHYTQLQLDATDVMQLQSVPFQVTGGTGGNSGALATASLPGCGATHEGAMAAVRDSITNKWGATIKGGGTNHVLAYCDGNNWTVAAK
jgi:hypothetical protein